MAFLDAPGKFEHFINCNSITFLLLFDYFEWSVLLAEDSINSFTLDPLDLHEVVRAPSTLNVEGDHALRVLALDAGTLVLLPTDDALQVEALVVALVQSNGGLGRHDRPWDPHCTAEVNPFVQGLSWWH